MMCIKINKTEYMIIPRGEIRKCRTITAHGQTIERVDTTCDLAFVFRHKNTFQAAMKQNIDTAKKALFKIEFLLSRVNLQVKTRIHLCDNLLLPILLNGCELWGYEHMEQIFSHKFFETDAENT